MLFPGVAGTHVLKVYFYDCKEALTNVTHKMCVFSAFSCAMRAGYIGVHIHGCTKYGPIQVIFFNIELRIADHYLRPLTEPYINI